MDSDADAAAPVFVGERAATQAEHDLIERALAMPLTVETLMGGDVVVTRQHVTIGVAYEEMGEDATLVAMLSDVVKGQVRWDGGGAAELFCYRPGWVGDELDVVSLCASCGRNMDTGEPHTGECPSALAQDAEDMGKGATR
jgi:hypothetical protein